MSIASDIKAIVAARLRAREAESEKTRRLVCALLVRDPGASVKVSDLRQALLFATGRRVGDAEMVWAAACASSHAVARRPTALLAGQPRERVIDGCRWRHGTPRSILQALSARAVPSCMARASRYLRRNDWAKFPKHERSIFEHWAIFGRSPSRIAYEIGLAPIDVSASLTLHRARAGITRSE